MTYTPQTVWIGGPPVIQKELEVVALRPRRRRNYEEYLKAEQKQARDALIIQRRNDGDTYCDIAAKAGVSMARGRQIYSAYLMGTV